MELLIVDDELSSIQAVVSMIDMDSFGFDKHFNAQDITAAKNIVERETIDILLCDIEMRGESGLTLIQWIKEKGYPVECLISCYPNFEYAKTAMALGSNAYILKPIDINVLNMELNKAIKKREQAKQTRDDYRIAERNKLLASQKLWMDIYWGITIVDRKRAAQMEGKELFCFQPSWNFKFLTIIYQNSNKESITELDKILRFVYQNIVTELVDNLAREQGTENTGGIVVHVSDAAQLVVFYSEKTGVISDDDCTILCEIYKDVLAKYLLEENISIQYDIGKEVKLWESAEELDYLFVLNENNSRSKLTNPENVTDNNDSPAIIVENQIVARTIGFIEEHLGEDLNMDIIAGNEYLNPNYLTRIFKQVTGHSIKHYIVEKRMKLAMNLLRNTDLPISEISYQAGYYNYTSFNRIFSKYVGMSPHTFKKSEKERNK